MKFITNRTGNFVLNGNLNTTTNTVTALTVLNNTASSLFFNPTAGQNNKNAAPVKLYFYVEEGIKRLWKRLYLQEK